MSDTSKRVDELLMKKTGISSNLEQIRENIVFVDKVQNNPVNTESFNDMVFGVEIMNINPYIEQQALPSSIYFIDKLIRLNTKASLEWMKRYLAKKRHVPIQLIWILIIVFGVIVAIVVVMLLLPKLGVI